MTLRDALDGQPASGEPAPETPSRRVPGLLRAETFILSISLESWHGMFAAAGEALVVDDYDALFQRLEQVVPVELIEGLEFIHSYASEGIDFLLQLLEAAGINDAPLGSESATTDLLATIWARSRTDRRLRRIVVVAQLEAAAREGKRACQRYVGPPEERLRWAAETQSRLEGLLAEAFRSKGLTQYVRLDIRAAGDRVSVYVLRGGRKQRVVRMNESSGESEPDDIRATQCDLVHLDLREVRLEVMPSEQRLAERYAAAFGEALVGAQEFFKVEDSFDLGALLRAGRKAIAAEGRPDVSVFLERVEWEPRPGARMTAKASDCFEVLEAELRRPGNQRVVLARLSFRFVSGRRPIGVTLRPPNSIKCSSEADHDEVHDILRRLGLLGSSHRSTFWEFAAGPRPTVRWRRALGSRFDTLLAKGLVTKVLLESAPDGEHSSADGAVRALEEFEGLAVGVDDDVPARRVSAADFEAYTLNLERLGASLCSKLRLQETPKTRLPDGVLELGRRQFRAQVVRVFLVAAPPGDPSFLAVALRARQPTERAVLLAPPELHDDGTIDVVRLIDWVPPFGNLIDHFFDRLGLRDEMDVDEAAGQARLVVRADGVFLDKKVLELTPQQVKLVQLIIARPAKLSADELGEELRSSGENKGLAGDITRKAKSKLGAEIRRALAADPPSPETDDAAILKTERGSGYRFLVEAIDLTVNRNGSVL